VERSAKPFISQPPDQCGPPIESLDDSGSRLRNAIARISESIENVEAQLHRIAEDLLLVGTGSIRDRSQTQQPKSPLSGSRMDEILGSLPSELSTEEVAQVLGCSKDTVLKLKQDGTLEYRNVAPMTGSRPVYRFTLESVRALRTSYSRDVPEIAGSQDSVRRSRKQKRQFKHFKFVD